MRSLQIAWAGLFGLGVIMVAIDAISAPLISVNNVPALGVIGAALILLVVSSILNWLFKDAREGRDRANTTKPTVRRKILTDSRSFTWQVFGKTHRQRQRDGSVCQRAQRQRRLQRTLPGRPGSPARHRRGCLHPRRLRPVHASPSREGDGHEYEWRENTHRTFRRRHRRRFRAIAFEIYRPVTPAKESKGRRMKNTHRTFRRRHRRP